MPTLRPLHDVNQHDILPFYTWSGNLPVNKGTFVKLVGSGLVNQNLQLAGAIGSTYNNVVSERWTVVPQVATVSATGDKVIGMLLFDGRTVDENGENLLYRPRKAAEMQVFTSGQAVPIATRGLFQYSGISGTVVAGADAYFNQTDGSLMTEGRPEQKVGRFLGVKDSNGVAVVKIDIV